MLFNIPTKAKEIFYRNKNSKLKAENVQAAIDELKEENDKASVSIETILASPTWKKVTAGIVQIIITKKAGETRIICSSAPGVGIAENTWTIIGTIDPEYRPAINIPFIGSYGTVMFIGYVYTNGNIIVYSPIAITTTGNAMCINVSYPV